MSTYFPVGKYIVIYPCPAHERTLELNWVPERCDDCEQVAAEVEE